MRQHIHIKCFTRPIFIESKNTMGLGERWCPHCRTSLHYVEIVTVSDDLKDPLYPEFVWRNPNPIPEV
jgi:hypothetical protein